MNALIYKFTKLPFLNFFYISGKKREKKNFEQKNTSILYLILYYMCKKISHKLEYCSLVLKKRKIS